MQKQLAYIIVVAVLLTAGVPAQSDVKIAIVPGGDPKPHELLVLTEAKLFELNEIELLDRTEIDKVLAEQRLSGMFDANNACHSRFRVRSSAIFPFSSIYPVTVLPVPVPLNCDRQRKRQMHRQSHTG